MLTRCILGILYTGLSASWVPALWALEEANESNASSGSSEPIKRQQKDRSNAGPLWILEKLDWKTGLGSETKIIFYRKCSDLSLRREWTTVGGSLHRAGLPVSQSAPEEDRG